MSTQQRAIVIGAGITGTLLALQLRRAGFAVTMLEGAWVGAGSSSRTAAGIRQQFSTRATVRGMRYSVRFYRQFAEGIEGAGRALVQNGYLFLYGDPDAWKQAKQRVRQQQEWGLSEVEALEGEALYERFSWVGREANLGGTWCPTDGFLHPEVIYGEAARQAREMGAELIQKAAVTDARVEGGRIVAVHTDKGDHEADLYFDCTNAWSRRLAERIDAVELPVDPLKRYLWFLKREGSLDAGTLAGMPLVITPSGTYCRPENADTLLMGKKHAADAEVDFDYEDQDHVEPAFSHKTGIDAVPYQCWMELAEALPPVGEFGGITATTSGYYGTTPDHNPFFGYDPHLSNLVRLVGFSGHGAMFGPFTAWVGRALAEAGEDLDEVTLDNGDTVSLDAFRIGRDYDQSEQMVI